MRERNATRWERELLPRSGAGFPMKRYGYDQNASVRCPKHGRRFSAVFDYKRSEYVCLHCLNENEASCE